MTVAKTSKVSCRSFLSYLSGSAQSHFIATMQYSAFPDWPQCCSQVFAKSLGPSSLSGKMEFRNRLIFVGRFISGGGGSCGIEQAGSSSEQMRTEGFSIISPRSRNIMLPDIGLSRASSSSSSSTSTASSL